MKNRDVQELFFGILLTLPRICHINSETVKEFTATAVPFL